ncbi:V-type ATP synthase subunit D [Microbacter sp. GSS18]|nr:V-type ATP synthase subunit D [Microbacter sp. GSS18]
MNTPASRPARARLERRLAVARHAAELLERRQRIMADEVERLELQADRSRAEWERLARDAAVWLRRATALDGRERIHEAAPLEEAAATVTWSSAMGALRPDEIACELPPKRAVGGSSALALAAAAHRDALVAGVRHAVIDHARARLAAELQATQVRRRAIERRWVPRLEQDLRRMRDQLEQQDLEETLRLRWAADLSAEERSPS